MKTTRRELLAGVAALATVPAWSGGCAEDPPGDPAPVGQPAPDRPAEPAPWDAPGSVDEALFPMSVQAGDVSAEGVVLSVRTEAAAVDLVLMRGEGEGWVEADRIEGLAPVGQTVQVALDGLQPDTVYRYAWYADEQARSPVGRFRTAPDANGWRKLTIGATSCLGGSNPDWESLAWAAEEDLDVFLLLGDTVYADAARELEAYRGYYERALSKPSLAALTASTSLVAAWDDHEVSNNWYLEGDPADPMGDEVSALRLDEALAAFREALPQREGSGELGLWRKLSWGSIAELYVLDCRGERRGTRMVSPEQLQWLIDEVRASEATFKLVLSSIHLADHSMIFGNVAARDRWQGHPDQREPLVRALAEVPGVLVITGDMHFGSIQRVGIPGELGDGLWEVAAGPGGSKLNLLPTLIELPEQYPVILDTWSYARFILDPGTGEVEVRLIGDDGEVLGERTLALWS